jgi:hypothetical protein
MTCVVLRTYLATWPSACRHLERLVAESHLQNHHQALLQLVSHTPCLPVTPARRIYHVVLGSLMGNRFDF